MRDESEDVGLLDRASEVDPVEVGPVVVVAAADLVARAVLGVEDVATRVTAEDVVPGARVDRVVAGLAQERVAAGVTVEMLRRRRTGRPRPGPL
jgi:hypothetical protein